MLCLQAYGSEHALLITTSFNTSMKVSMLYSYEYIRGLDHFFSSSIKIFSLEKIKRIVSIN